MKGFSRNGLKGNSLKVLTEEEVLEIHQKSLKILAEGGIQVRDKEVASLLQGKGAVVVPGSDIIRIPEELVEDALKKAPSTFSLYDRVGEERMLLGGEEVYARVPGGATKYLDPVEGKKRTPTLEDVANIIKVADALPNIAGVSVFPTVPGDVPIEKVDIFSFETAVKNTTKPLFYVCHNEALLDEILEMAALIKGGWDNLQEKPFLTVLVEASPPLKIGNQQLTVLKKFAAAGLPVMLHSHHIAGLSCPVTLASEVLLTNTEMLALTVISQSLQPGLPVIRGMSSSVPNMKNVLNLSGAIEIGLLAVAMSQMARFYRIPSSMSSGTDSKLPDAQASIERLFTSLPAVLGMTDLINITTIDTKMCFSLEQLVIDNEIMEMIGRYLRGIQVNKDTLAVEEILSVGPGGSYLTSMVPHTMKHHRKELQTSSIFDRDSGVNWEKSGGKDLQSRARMEALRLIKEHQPLKLPETLEKSLESIIQRA